MVLQAVRLKSTPIDRCQHLSGILNISLSNIRALNNVMVVRLDFLFVNIFTGDLEND